MGGSTTAVSNVGEPPPHGPQGELSQLKTLGFAISIIMGLGGITAFGVGIGGYFQSGVLSNLGQVRSIVIMTVGGGAVLLSVAIFVTLEKCAGNGSGQEFENGDGENITLPKNNLAAKPVINTEIISTIDTHGGVLFGPDAWKVWNIEVLDNVSSAPPIAWDEKDPYYNEPFRKNYALFYIPSRVLIKGEEQDLNFLTFKKNVGPIELCSSAVENHFGKNMAPGWVLLSKRVISEEKMEYEELKKTIEAQEHYHMQSILEAFVLNLMIYAFTGEKLYKENPFAVSCCEERIKNGTTNVGSFSKNGLSVFEGNFSKVRGAVARRIF